VFDVTWVGPIGDKVSYMFRGVPYVPSLHASAGSNSHGDIPTVLECAYTHLLNRLLEYVDIGLLLHIQEDVRSFSETPVLTPSTWPTSPLVTPVLTPSTWPTSRQSPTNTPPPPASREGKKNRRRGRPSLAWCRRTALATVIVIFAITSTHRDGTGSNNPAFENASADGRNYWRFSHGDVFGFRKI